jgi:hypothetical protein
LVIASLVAIQLRYGEQGFPVFIQQWALTNLAIMLAAAALTWLCLGGLLYLLANHKINAANVLTFAGFFVLVFVYLNILRERFRYGDYAYYIEAATALFEHRQLPDTYLYLPLWATLLQFIVPLGDQGVLLVLWLLNMVALGCFYFLLHRVLERYEFSGRLAALTAFAFILVNAPIQRTLGFVQVNLLVMGCVLGSILLYPRRSFLSALMLALAIHLKTSPAVLVLAFLLERDWRWLAWLAASFLGIAAIPLVLNGPAPYVDFLNNTLALTQITDTNFHETSFDSFLRFATPFLGIQPPWIRILIYAAKAVLGVLTVLVMRRDLQHGASMGRRQEGGVMLNAIPSLFILMTLAPPIVWDHHGVFVALPFLLLLKRLEAPAAWVWFGFAYFLQFVMPSFDFFPWSFGRLLAPLIVLGLLWRTAPQTAPASWFAAANRWLVTWPDPKGQQTR